MSKKLVPALRVQDCVLPVLTAPPALRLQSTLAFSSLASSAALATSAAFGALTKAACVVAVVLVPSTSTATLSGISSSWASAFEPALANARAATNVAYFIHFEVLVLLISLSRHPKTILEKPHPSDTLAPARCGPWPSVELPLWQGGARGPWPKRSVWLGSWPPTDTVRRLYR